MKKLLLQSILLFFLFSNAYSQAGMWTWMGGSSTMNYSGNFGVQGIPSPTNKPPAAYEAIEWTDNSGNFWFYGGTNAWLFYDDLWKYDVSTNEWTWMKGSGGLPNQAPVYGIMGVSNPNITPGERATSSSWKDNQGNFWLFGGFGLLDTSGSSCAYNDLWKYSISTNEWTWMKGDTFSICGLVGGNYGVKGVEDSLNNPPHQWEMGVTWTANNGDLWMLDFNGCLWKYRIATNNWIWMKGKKNGVAVYGQKGVATATTTPGNNEWSYTRWKDSNDNFWFLYSRYYDRKVLFKYELASNNWTWMWGDTLLNYSNTDSQYGDSLCDTSEYVVPFARGESRACWIDNCDNLWLMGGFGNDHSTPADLNDLIYFDTQQLNWVWAGNDTSHNYNSNYGTIGVASPLNKPAARAGAIPFKDSNGNLWLYGGCITNPFTFYGDLWKFNMNSGCPPCYSNNQNPITNLQSSDTSFCDKHCLNFFDLSTNNPTSWQWLFPGSDSLTSALQNPTNICYNNYGSFDVTLIACNANGCDTLFLPNFINEYQKPTDSIYQSNDTLFSLPAFTYQWYEVTSGLIAGAINQYFVLQQQGNYYCLITDSIGCVASSNTIVIAALHQISNNNFPISVIPNPFNNEITITFQKPSISKASLSIRNTLGQEVYQQNFSDLSSKNKFTIDLSFLPKGIYLLDIKMPAQLNSVSGGNKESYFRKIVKN